MSKKKDKKRDHAFRVEVKISDVVKEMYGGNPQGTDELYRRLQNAGINEPISAIITYLYAGVKTSDVTRLCDEDGFDIRPLLRTFMHPCPNPDIVFKVIRPPHV